MVKKKPSLKEKILKHLIENRGKKESIRQISGALLIDYKNTFNEVNRLLPELITIEKLGNINLVGIKLVPSQEIYAIEEKRTNEFLSKMPKLKLIQEDIKDINYPFMIVLIFGSFVKRTNNKSSDIDICVICDNETKRDKLTLKLKLLPFPLEIQEFNIEEFESMLEKKWHNLAHEIVKNNILLYGIENYYNLVSRTLGINSGVCSGS